MSGKQYLNCHLNNSMKGRKMNQELEMLERVSSDNEWFQRNYEELKADFKNEFVAVKDKQIIAHSDDFNSVLKNLEERGEDPALILIDFVTKKGTEIM
jgi:hypothetical protein